MNRQEGVLDVVLLGVPRTRGDEPSLNRNLWLPFREFPAHAGMNRDLRGDDGRTGRVPRTRGDEPGADRSDKLLVPSSPHTRG